MGKKGFGSQTDLKIAMIADEDTVAGFALAGVGHRDGMGNTNFLTVDSSTFIFVHVVHDCAETRRSEIEEAFRSFTTRRDIGIIMINQHICDEIRHVIKEYSDSGQTIPTVLEIPSVDHPYDPKKDSIMQRVLVFFGGNVTV